MASSTSCSGNSIPGCAYATLFNLRARHFGIEAIHGIGRFENQHFLAGVHISIDEDLYGLIGAVGENELFRRHVEIPRDGLLRFAIFRIHRQAFRR